MTNQSLLSVPPNVAEPLVLQRFLMRLLEQVDIISGNRAAAEYAEQEQLLAATQALIKRLQVAEATLEDLIALANELAEQAVDTLQFQVDQNTSDIKTIQDAIQDYVAIKAVQLNFTVDGSNNIVHNLDYNIDTSASSRISTGVYEFSLDQATILGNSVVDNSTASLAWVIAANANSELFQVNFEEVDGDTFRLNVHEFTVVGASNKLTLAKYDLAPGDTVTVTVLFNVPGAGLPPA